MRFNSRVSWLWVSLAAIAVMSLLSFVFGVRSHFVTGEAGGVLGLTYVAIRGARRIRRARADRQRTSLEQPVNLLAAAAANADNEDDDEPAGPDACETGDLNDLIEQMFTQGRSALLLRHQIASQLSREQIRRAAAALQEEMALVPDGEVVVEGFDDAMLEGELDSDHSSAVRGNVVNVQRVFLDRYPVTNRQFWHFVKAGGYTQMALWDPEVWPAVLDFVDATGNPGPRFWHNGKFIKGEDGHPVIGVSWYEAAAFARWVGKRLPTDPEWVKAGSWPVVLSQSSRLQRRYPWGDSMDRKRANLWNSGPGRIVGVHEFGDGMSVGGIHQLIGNVWEWTASEFAPDDCPNGHVLLGTTMRSLRGGAFDTYFDSHATCQFATGDNPVTRKHNIGFRCALSVCDLSLFSAPPAASPSAQSTNDSAATDSDALDDQPARDHLEHSACEEITV